MPAATDRDLDPADPAFFLRADFHQVLARLRAEAPVHEYAPGMRTVACYEGIREMSRDPARFSSGNGVLINDPFRGMPAGTPAPTIIHQDPPQHTRYRQLVNREFTPRAVARLEARVRDLTRSLLDAIEPDAPVDIVEAVASPLPVLVIAELLGIPAADRQQFRRWSDAVISMPDHDEDAAAAGELFAFLSEHIKRLAGAAEPGQDVLSRLTRAEVDGVRLTQSELVMFAVTLLVAGNETTRHLVSGAVETLAAHPDQRAALAEDPATIPGAVEECLRWVTPIQAFARTATADTTVAGHPVSEGDYLVMLYASGNRDEAAFGPTAGRFDVRRPVDPAHVAFGFGEHLCLGAALARLEGRVVLGSLVERFPTWELAGEPERVASTIVRGISRLPVVLHP